jgi:hypothetical protein
MERRLALVVAAAALAVLAGVAFGAWRLAERRRNADPFSLLMYLRFDVHQAEDRFRELGFDDPRGPRYGTLEELERLGLLSRAKRARFESVGYVFSSAVSATTPEFLYWVTATARDGDMGEANFFFVNQAEFPAQSDTAVAIDADRCEPVVRPKSWRVFAAK